MGGGEREREKERASRRVSIEGDKRQQKGGDSGGDTKVLTEFEPRLPPLSGADEPKRDTGTTGTCPRGQAKVTRHHHDPETPLGLPACRRGPGTVGTVARCHLCTD